MPGLGSQIGAALKGPNEVRWRDYIFYVNYGNSGDADGIAPLLIVENLGTNSFEIQRDDLISEAVPAGATIQLLGIGYDGPAGILRPGELGSIPVFFRTTHDEGNFRLQVITADDPRPLYFEDIEDQIRPSDVSDEEWAEIRPLLMDKIGDTWGSYVRALSEIATYMDEVGYRSQSVVAIFRALYQQTVVSSNATLRGYLYEENVCWPLSAGQIFIYDTEGSLINTAGIGGNLRYWAEVPPGSYLLTAEADGYARSIVENIIIAENDLLKQNIGLVPESIITGNIELSQPVPDDPRLTIVARETSQPQHVGTYHAEIEAAAFSIHHLPAGTYDIAFTAEGYLPLTIEDTVVTGQETVDIGWVTLYLSAEVSGTITNSVAGLSNEDLLVGAFLGGELVAGATVNEYGVYHFAGLEPGDYEIQLFDSEGRPHSPSVPVTLNHGDTITDIDMHGWPGAQITGGVEDALSAPLSGMTVVLIDSDGGVTYASTDENGMYHFTSLGLGTYYVALGTAGAATMQTIEVTDLDFTTYVADFSIASAASIEGAVSYFNGLPVENASVTIFEGEYYIGTAVSDEQGRYYFKLQRAGTYDLRAFAGDASFAAESIVASDGGNYTQNFVGGNGSIQITVGGGETDLEGTFVSISDMTEMVNQTTLDSGGIAVFNNLIPGEYTIEAYGSENKHGETQVTLTTGQSISTALEIVPKNTVSGNVYVDTQNGSYAPNLLVYFRSQADPTKTYPGFSDHTGAYLINYLDPGVYDAIILGEGYERTIQPNITVTEDSVINLIVSSVSAVVKGRLVDQSGHPVPLAYVSIYDADGLPCGDSAVNVDGTFSVEALAADNLIMTTVASGYLSREISELSAIVGENDLGDIVIEPLAHASAHGYPSSVEVGIRQTSSWQDLFTFGFIQDFIGIIYELTSEPEKSVLHVDGYPLWENRCVGELCYPYYDAMTDAIYKQDFEWELVDGIARDIFGLRGQWGAEFARYYAKAFNALAGLVRGKASMQALARRAPAQARLCGYIQYAIGLFENLILGADGVVNDAKQAVDADNHLQATQHGGSFFLAMQSTISGLQNGSRQVIEDELRRMRLGSTTPGVSPAQGTSVYRISASRFFEIVGVIKTLTIDLNTLMEKLYNLTYLIDVRMDDFEQKYERYSQKAAKARLRLVRYRSCIYSQEANDCDDDGDDNGDGGDGDDDSDASGGSSPNPPNPPDNPDPDSDPYDPQWVQSADPNDIIAPDGYGEEHWISGEATLPYIIRFENMSDATAPAQRVVITQPLDADLDYRTFRVTDFGWGNQYTEVNDDLPFYLGRIELTDESGLVVDVFATIDVISGLATWVLQTVDPATGEPPEDALAGFLPPNDENGIGEGFVSYTIRPRSDATTWSVIDAEATIVFDTNEPIDTPPVFNTIDAVAPTSSVTEATNEFWTANIFVTWGGEDDGGSALKNYNVYVSMDGGSYTIWLLNTTLTSAWFVGEQNHTYTFYCTSQDNAGNVEAFPSAPDAAVVIPIYEYETGDLNHDGYVDLADAVIALKVVSGVALTEIYYLDKEVNADGKIGSEELIYILQKMAQLR